MLDNLKHEVTSGRGPWYQQETVRYTKWDLLFVLKQLLLFFLNPMQNLKDGNEEYKYLFIVFMYTTDLFYMPEYYLYIFRVLQLGIACHTYNLQTTT